VNAGLEPDGPAAGFNTMFKRKQRPERPAIHQADAAVPEEDKVFNNTDGRISLSETLRPDDGQDDFGGTRLNTPPASLASAPQPPD
jgi:hypothetical protein